MERGDLDRMGRGVSLLDRRREEEAMEALIWVATGAIAGWVATRLMKGRSYGPIGNVIIGLLGSLVGVSLMQLLGGSAGGAWWQRALVAALGAIVLLEVARRLRPLPRPSLPANEIDTAVDLETQISRLSP